MRKKEKARTTLEKYGADFKKAVKFVLQKEGGYVNHPADPGGETKYGISKRAYPDLNIKDLTVEQAKEIYYRDYWLKAGCDEMDWPMSLVVFDTAVNMGVSRAKVFYRESRNWVDYVRLRLGRFAALAKDRNARIFLRGWVRRIVDLMTVALEDKDGLS